MCGLAAQLISGSVSKSRLPSLVLLSTTSTRGPLSQEFIVHIIDYLVEDNATLKFVVCADSTWFPSGYSHLFPGVITLKHQVVFYNHHHNNNFDCSLCRCRCKALQRYLDANATLRLWDWTNIRQAALCQ